jgi:hypothetical protein
MQFLTLFLPAFLGGDTEFSLGSHKSTKIKLVWPFTSNAGRENGKKSMKVETDVNTTTRKTKE